MNDEQIQAALSVLLQRAVDDETRAKAAQRFDKIEAGIDWAGTKITLPAEPYQMTPTEGIEWLNRIIKDEAQKINVHEWGKVYEINAMFYRTKIKCRVLPSIRSA